jgi:hypothetical protein
MVLGSGNDLVPSRGADVDANAAFAITNLHFPRLMLAHHTSLRAYCDGTEYRLAFQLTNASVATFRSSSSAKE